MQQIARALATGGARTHYEVSGEGSAVLMIQGAGVAGSGWGPQVDSLAARHTVIASDNRGFGRSTMDPGAPLTIDAMAQDALAIVEAEGIDRFHVVGHSMGGLIAQALALRVPARVMSLALLCTFVRGAEGARIGPAMLLTAIRMRVGTKRMRRNAFLGLVMPRAYLRTVDRNDLATTMGGLFGYDLANQPSFVMRQVRAMAAYDASSRWQELRTIPTLVVTATHDRIALPRYGRDLAARIGTARYVEMPDAGHAVTIQCADAINTLLEEHVTSVEASLAR